MSLDTTEQIESFLRLHMRHVVDPWLPECDACTDTVDEIIFYKVEKIQDVSLIQGLWTFCDELIDSEYENAGNIVCWKRTLATHPLASQEVFDTYTKQLLLEWELQEWDDWVLDPWEDMREVLAKLTKDPRFAASGATVESLAKQIHQGHFRFSLCEGDYAECNQCNEIAGEFAAA